MAHQRQLIREAVKAQLVGTAPAYRTAAGTRVFESRVIPWKRLELPAIAVYTLSDSVDPDSRQTTPRELTRTLELTIEAAVQASDDVDDAMDAISEQIEAAMDLDETLGGACGETMLLRTDLDFAEIADRPVGLARFTYSITYYTQPAVPTDLDDLATVGAKTSLGGTQAAADQTEDLITGLDE